MIKYSLIRDFKQVPIFGTLNMSEKTNFMCGKGMDIQDEIRISQISAIDGTDRFFNLKSSSITSQLLDTNQSEQERENLTKWKFIINGNNLLTEYLFDQIYSSNALSVFKTLPNEETSSGKSSGACYDYISSNIISRYKIKDVIFWTTYYDLKLGQTPGSNPVQLLKHGAVFNQTAKPIISPDSNKQTISLKEYNDGTFEIDYKQTKSSQHFTFLWYCDVIYVRA